MLANWFGTEFIFLTTVGYFVSIVFWSRICIVFVSQMSNVFFSKFLFIIVNEKVTS